MQWGEFGPLLHSPIARKLWSMVFGLIGVSWVMPKCVVELLASWQGWFGRHRNIAIWKPFRIVCFGAFGGNIMSKF